MRVPAVSISRWAINGNGDIFRSDGYVGIGLENPNETLTIGGNLQTNGQMFSKLPAALIPTGTTQTINWNHCNSQALDLKSATGDVTVTFINEKAGALYTLKVIQDSVVARNIIWSSNVLWPGGTAPTISAGANAIDKINLLKCFMFYSFPCNFELK